MLANEIREFVSDKSPETLFIGNESEHDSALIGLAYIKRDDSWVYVTMYEYSLLVESFIGMFEDSEDPETDAIEWISYNVSGAYVGIYTPMVISSEL
jgi:hypothetical protein